MNDLGGNKKNFALLRKYYGRRSGSVDFFFSLMARGAGAPLAFAANLLLARLLGPDSYGRYMTLLSAGLVAGGLAAYGVGPVLTREIAAQQHDQQLSAVLIMSRWALKLTGILSMGAILITFFWLSFGSHAPACSLLERIASVSIIPVSAWAVIAAGILAGLSQVGKSQAVVNVLKNGILAVGAAVFLFFEVRVVNDALWLQVISYALATSAGALWILQMLKRQGGQEILLQQKDYGIPLPKKEWQKSAGHFFIGSFAILLLGRFDVVIVNAIRGSGQAGVFGAAARLAQIAGITVMVWMAWLQPRLAFPIRHGDKSRVKYFVIIGFWGTLISTIAMVCASWFASPIIMGFLGPGFHASISPFRWIILGYVVWGASIPFYVFLTMSGRERIVAVACWIQLVLTLGASLPLITYYGALGAAWAWSGGLILTSLIIAWSGIRSYRLFLYEKNQ